jgi:hypothetical protein
MPHEPELLEALFQMPTQPAAREELSLVSVPSAAMLSAKQLANLEEFFAACDETTRLNDWEERFVHGLQARFKRDGEHTRLTEPQWDKIGEIEEKIYASG